MKTRSMFYNFILLGVIAASFVFVSTSYADITSGLIAYYPFNGNANDDSGNGNNGTVNGATLTTDRFGTPDGAYSFDGVDDYISIPDNASQQISTSQITISAWINLNYNVGSDQWRIVNKQETNNNSWGLEIFENGYASATGNNLTFHDSNGSAWINCIATEVNLSPQTLYHVAATDSNGVINLYINGSLVHTCSDGLGIPLNIASSIEIGKTTLANAYYFNGDIDSVRIYNRALSGADIQELYTENAIDLTVTFIANIPAHKKRGGKFTMKDIVRNQGFVAAGPFINGYYLSTDQTKSIDDIAINGNRNVSSLEAGKSSSKKRGIKPVKVQIPSDTPLGTYYVIVCADNMDQITESDETNNCMASKKTIRVHK